MEFWLEVKLFLREGIEDYIKKITNKIIKLKLNFHKKYFIMDLNIKLINKLD